MAPASDIALARRGGADGSGGLARRFEYRSRLGIAGLPLVHVVRGVDPVTGRRRVAVGVIAVGQVAVGAIAVGQLAVGGIAIGQAAIGVVGSLGQVAVAAVAAGQLAVGASVAVGQLAAAPLPFGLVSLGGALAAGTWAIAGAVLSLLAARRRRRLGALLASGPADAIAALREGPARIWGRVASADALRAPLSGEACAAWWIRTLGPGTDDLATEGDAIVVDDGTGQARLALDQATLLLAPRATGEGHAPDWSIQIESTIRQGQAIAVAGHATLETDPEAASGGYRVGPVRAVFRAAGRTAPLVVTTRPLDEMRAQLLAVGATGAALSLAGAIALFPAAPLAALASALIGLAGLSPLAGRSSPPRPAARPGGAAPAPPSATTMKT